MNRKILLSGLSIFTALSLTVGSAFAAFSSQADNTGNTFGAGTLTLSINTQTGTFSAGAMNFPSMSPGQTVSQLFVLKNEGSVNATSVKVVGLNPGGTGLAGNLTLVLFNDVNGNGVLDSGETVFGTAHLDDPSWTNFVLTGVTLPAGNTYNLGAQVTLDSSTDNTHQGQTGTFDLNLEADQ